MAESARSRKQSRRETLSDSISDANYSRMYNEGQNIHADAQQPQQQRRASKSPTRSTTTRNSKADKNCTYLIPDNNNTSITKRCTKKCVYGTCFCTSHAAIVSMLESFNFISENNNGETFLHYNKNIQLTKKGLSAIFNDAKESFPKDTDGQIEDNQFLPKILLDLIDVDFVGTSYKLTSQKRASYYALPDGLAAINMKAITDSSTDDTDRLEAKTNIENVFDGTFGHDAFVKFFDHFQDIEREICSVGEDPLNIGILARLEGRRLYATKQKPLPPPVGGTMIPYGWKFSHHKKGEVKPSLVSMYFPPKGVHTPYYLRDPSYKTKTREPSNPTNGVYTRQINGLRGMVKVQHLMYGDTEEDEDDESTSTSSSSIDVSWQQKTQEVVFLKDELKPQVTEDIVVIDVSPVDVIMGLPPVFFERVEGNAVLIRMMKDKLEEYKAGNYEKQRSVLLEILKVLRGKGARILRVNRSSLPAEEEDDTSGVTFDDVGGQFFVYHLGPFIYSFHLKVAPKEGKYKWGDLPMYHQLIAQSILAETDDNDMEEELLLDALRGLYNVSTLNRTEDDDSLRSDMTSKSYNSDDESEYSSDDEFSDSELTDSDSSDSELELEEHD